MNRAQAKEILLLYRPGAADALDQQVMEAVELARQDPELARWFEQHQAFQSGMRAKFREIETPEHLKRGLLARRKIIRPTPWWQTPAWFAAAAVLVLLLSLAPFWLRPSAPDRFGDYRQRMVSAALRVYGMDLQTNDMRQLRRFIAAHGAPADYDVTKGLARLELKGGGLLRWRGNPVSMVCFDRGDSSMLFLFIVKRSAVKDPPSEVPAHAKLAKVDDLMTASWTQADNTYVLAGPQESGFVEKYVEPR